MPKKKGPSAECSGTVLHGRRPLDREHVGLRAGSCRRRRLGATGPLFGFSDTWQLVINTGTTIVTFLMVFLIQRSQNKDSMAIQLKLNELVAALKGASNRLIDIEELSEEELNVLHRHYAKLVTMAKKEADVTNSHSVEEAEARHAMKTSVGVTLSRSSSHGVKHPRARRRLGAPRPTLNE